MLVHLIFMTGALKNKDIPEHWAETIPTWEKFHPTAQVKLWRDDDVRQLMVEHYPTYLDMFDQQDFNIQRVDLAKTFILDKHGGIYSDLDIMPKQDITPLYNMFLANTATVGLVETPNACTNYMFSNYLMFSKKNSMFWKHYWAYVQEKSWTDLAPWYLNILKQNFRHFDVLLSTGPTSLSIICNNYEEKKDVFLISNTYVGQTNSCYPSAHKVQPWHMFEHLEGESWTDWSTQFFKTANVALDYKETILATILAIICIVLIILLAVR
jgi:mannosyltransferase OCH1-like enzyme